MKFLSHEECVSWCAVHGYSLSTRDGQPYPEIEPQGFHYAEFLLPKDSGAKVALAREALRAIGGSSGTLIWLRNWEVWPSSGHVPVIKSVRRALGENRNLQETPGHIPLADEDDEALSILIICLEFFWDCVMLAPGGCSFFYTSHDEYFVLGSKDEAAVEGLTSFVEKAGWKQS
jgi:hypothetical protein